MISIPTTIDSETFAVKTDKLSKRFGKSIALDEIAFTVPEHSFYVLVGPNGAGKTTLFKLLLEIIRPSSGSAHVLGYDPQRAGAEVRARVGYIPERSEDLYTWMSVRRALEFHRSYYPSWDAEYAADLMKQLRVKEGRLMRLSKGEVRRVQLVMALAHRPPLLLLDEPTDGLDPVGREVFLGILADHIAATPTTVIVSTHLVYEFENLADHLGVLSNGKLIAQLRTDALRAGLKRYVVGDAATPAFPADAVFLVNGSQRERAYTLWGDEDGVSAQFVAAGADLREVRTLTLHEAAVAFLKREAL